MVPPEILSPPTLPTLYIWKCPAQSANCKYKIHLLEPNASNLEGLSLLDQVYLQNQTWSLGEPRIVEIFIKMVNHHYDNHLKEVGVKLMKVSEFIKIGKDLS